MISPFNQPACKYRDCQDFTLEHYQLLLRKAKDNYEFVNYRNIPFGSRFLLWRHDCDFSLNRSLELAKIERKEGIRSTFFLNPNSDFYNIFERNQMEIVKAIVKLGHDIGLHFDASSYAVENEMQLTERLRWLARILKRLFGPAPCAFSFHNPSISHLSFASETYAGLVNCYSQRFKTHVGYCSDSNGYWRYRRLIDVLTEATDPCLQVLTHPGWWQGVPMPPRQRIFHCAYGRAKTTMRLYDEEIENFGRENFAGAAQAVRFLRPVYPDIFELCDFLWNSQRFETLFVELWRLHEIQINRLCKAVFLNQWRVPADLVRNFFECERFDISCQQLFRASFGCDFLDLTGQDIDNYIRLAQVKEKLLGGCEEADKEELEDDCVSLCKLIESVANWGLKYSLKYNGLTPLITSNVPAQDYSKEDLTEHPNGCSANLERSYENKWNMLLTKIKRKP